MNFPDTDEEGWEENDDDGAEQPNLEDVTAFFAEIMTTRNDEEGNARAMEPAMLRDSDEYVEKAVNEEAGEEIEKDESPYGHIKMILSLADSRRRVQLWWHDEAQDLEFKNQVGEKLIEFIKLDPSCAGRTFEISTGDYTGFGRIKMPLIHWVVDLELPLPVLQAIQNAYPDACKMCYPEGDPKQLPISQALIRNSPIEIIQFLLECNPASATLLDKERLRNYFWNSTPANFDEGFNLIQSLLKEEDVASLTSVGSISWDHTKPFPEALLNFIVNFHDLKSMTVKGTIGDRYNTGVKVNVDRELNVLNVEFLCDRSFDLAVEELLKLPIPLTELGTSTWDEESAIRYLICTISPSVMDSDEQKERREAEYQSMVDSMERLGLPPIRPDDPHYMEAAMQGMLPVPPGGTPVEDLDLSSVEKISFGSLIPSTVELMHLLKGLQKLPNLKFLKMDGAQNLRANVTLPEGEGFADLMALVDRLEELSISSLKTCIPTVAEFVKKTKKLKVLSLTHSKPYSLEEVNLIIEALRANKSIEHLQFGQLVTDEGAKTLLEFVKGSHHLALKTYQGYNRDSPLVTDIDFFCRLHQSTSWLESENRTKAEAVSEYSKFIGDLSFLYGLLRHRPDLWS